MRSSSNRKVDFDCRDMYDGAEFVCVFNDGWDADITVGRIYTLRKISEDITYGTMYRVLGAQDEGISLDMSELDLIDNYYGNARTWFEIFPCDWLAPEEKFHVALSGEFESILGKRHDSVIKPSKPSKSMGGVVV